MSDNVIPFPIEDSSDWGQVSKMLISKLLDTGIPESSAQEFVDSFKKTFELFQFSYPMPVSEGGAVASEDLDSFVIELQRHITKLLMERFAREVNDYFSTH